LGQPSPRPRVNRVLFGSLSVACIRINGIRNDEPHFGQHRVTVSVRDMNRLLFFLRRLLRTATANGSEYNAAK
jgi:hypothetical protein